MVAVSSKNETRAAYAQAETGSLADPLIDTHGDEQVVVEDVQSTLGYRNVRLQFVDDRTKSEQAAIYPAGGLEVRIVGTEFRGVTDPGGYLDIETMPIGSRFLITADDSTQTFHPAIFELEVTPKKEVVQLRMIREVVYQTETQVFGVSPVAGYASFCGRIHRGGYPVAGVAVKLDVSAYGPFYRNSQGYPDRHQSVTAGDGRFCFYQVIPGPVAVSIFEAGQDTVVSQIALYENRHTEQSFNLARSTTTRLNLAMMQPAHAQLNADRSLRYQSAHYVNLIALGEEAPFDATDPGVVSIVEYPAPQTRIWAYADAPELEPAIYPISATASKQALPLIPRGFIDDMAFYAQVFRDQTEGVIIAEYLAPKTTKAPESIVLRLVDQYGRDHGTGWYFADAPLTKAIFFNVPPGSYSLIAETKDGYWLGGEVVTVYSETTSFVRLGGALKAR